MYRRRPFSEREWRLIRMRRVVNFLSIVTLLNPVPSKYSAYFGVAYLSARDQKKINEE